MVKRHYISEEEVVEIKKVQKGNKDKTIDKWLEVLVLHAAGEKRSEISSKTGFSKQYITDLVSEYKRVGLKEYSAKQYKGNNRNLSFSEEETLLEIFKKQAEKGQVIEVSTIKKAYEEKLGREIKSKGHIYYILDKHGWRKVMPRSKHPNKANNEEIESSKKLTLRQRKPLTR